MRLGLNGVPRGSDAGSFGGKSETAPAPSKGVQGVYSSITPLHVHRRDQLIEDAKDWVYASLWHLAFGKRIGNESEN